MTVGIFTMIFSHFTYERMVILLPVKLGFNYRLNTKLPKHPDGYVLADTIKDKLSKGVNKAISVDNGVYEKKLYRTYELLKKRS